MRKELERCSSVNKAVVDHHSHRTFESLQLRLIFSQAAKRMSFILKQIIRIYCLKAQVSLFFLSRIMTRGKSIKSSSFFFFVFTGSVLGKPKANLHFQRQGRLINNK